MRRDLNPGRFGSMALKRGRPPRGSKAARQMISIRVTRDARAAYLRAARAERTTVADWIRQLIVRALDQRELR